MEMDVEKFAEHLSDEELVSLIREARNADDVHGALNELARRDSPLQFDVCRLILDDPKQSLTAKRTAAARVGVGDLTDIRDALTRHLATEDPVLFSRIVNTLAKIGGMSVMEQLESVTPPEDPTAIRALRFAKILLAYRWHVDEYRIQAPSEAQMVRPKEGVPISWERVDKKTLGKALSDSASDVPAIPLVTSAATKLICNSMELLIVANAEMEEAATREPLLRRPCLPAILLKKAESLDRYFLDTYFFMQPALDSNSPDLLGIRPRGDLTYAGHAYPTKTGYRFTLHSTDTRYAPAVDIEGEYNAHKQTFAFSRAMSSIEIAAREHKPKIPRRAR